VTDVLRKLSQQWLRHNVWAYLVVAATQNYLQKSREHKYFALKLEGTRDKFIIRRCTKEKFEKLQKRNPFRKFFGIIDLFKCIKSET